MDINEGVMDKISTTYGLDEAMLTAAVQVESNGVGFWNVTLNGVTRDLPVIRFEGHYFYKRLTGDQLKAAITQGLASKKAGAVKNSKSAQGRYNMLERAMKINKEAALESVSMGVGQVMGANWKACGFKSASDMFAFLCTDPTLSHQIYVMARYIVSIPLLKRATNERNCKTFALYYNGKNYAAGGYDVKLFKALNSVGSKMIVKPQSQVVNEDYQKDIQDLGYENTNKFQQEKGLVPDGKIGPATIDAIKDEQRAKAERAAAPKKQAVSIFAKIGALFTTGMAGAVASAGDAKDAAQPIIDTISGWYGDYGTYVGYGLITLVAGSAIGYYFLNKQSVAAE